MSQEFRIFTLNCWGLVGVSKDRYARIQAIAEVLATSQYDVVCLQEVWSNNDYLLIKHKVSGVLPFAHYFYSGVTGSGVCILSRHPIMETFFHQWCVNGYIHKLHHGDWFGGKGVGLCRVKMNDFFINVYSAHLHAEYNRASDEYQAHRVLQAYDTAQFILLTSGNTDLIVLAGDLNTEPGDLTYRVMLGVPGLTDAFTKVENISQDMLATNEALKNSYTPRYLVKKKYVGKRIDYIMYHPGSNVKVDVKKYDLPLPFRVPNQSFSYSDHEAISATLVIEKSKTPNHSTDLELKTSSLEDSVLLCNEALESLARSKISYWVYFCILLILFVVSWAAEPLYDIPVVYYVLRFVVSVLMVFALVMATIWNQIEKHGVLSGKLAMEVTLQRLKKDSHRL